MASLKRHISPEMPFMELYNVIFLPSPYRRGGDSGEVFGVHKDDNVQPVCLGAAA